MLGTAGGLESDTNFLLELKYVAPAKPEMSGCVFLVFVIFKIWEAFCREA